MHGAIAAETSSANQEPRDVPMVEFADVGGQVLGGEPRREPQEVALVLLNRVRRPAVRAELDEESGEGGGEAQGGQELVLEVARRREQ